MNYILTADWHLRETTPTAWAGDDFQKTQEKRVAQVYSIAEGLDADVIVAGDIFHSWTCGFNLPYMVNWHCSRSTFFIPGNHELPQHQYSQFPRSPCSALDPTSFFNACGEVPRKNIVGKIYGNTDPYHQGDILVIHEMVWQTPPFPGADPSGNALRILNRYKEGPAKLIVCGDNHTPFHIFKDGVHLVNCGPIIRQKAHEIDIKPCVWLYDSDDHTVESIELDFRYEDISREHISVRDEREDRLASFVESLGDLETTLDFEKNLEIAAGLANLTPKEREVLSQCVEQSKTRG